MFAHLAASWRKLLWVFLKWGGGGVSSITCSRHFASTEVDTEETVT